MRLAARSEHAFGVRLARSRSRAGVTKLEALKALNPSALEKGGGQLGCGPARALLVPLEVSGLGTYLFQGSLLLISLYRSP